MRSVDSAAQVLRAGRAGLAERKLVWISARDRDTHAVEALGLWTGEDTETITVVDMFTGGTAPRDFVGAGGLLGIDGLQHQSGLNVRPVRLSLSALDATVMAAVRLYDVRGARVQIWNRTLDPETGLAVGDPEPLFKGFVNKAPIPRPVADGVAVIELEAVSSVRLLSIPRGRRKSEAAQLLRDPDDHFRRFKSGVRSVDVPWGQKDDRV
jgi:hypothetical protein